MGDIYFNLSAAQINIKIEEKSALYRNHVFVADLHCELDEKAVEYKCVKRNSNNEYFTIARYVGLSEGIEIYHFCNVITGMEKEKPEESEEIKPSINTTTKRKAKSPLSVITKRLKTSK